MSSLTDYINWYADYSFYDIPFNEVDNLILSTLTYYNYDLKRDEGRPMALRRCVTNSTANNSFLRAVCSSRRFGSMMVSDFFEVFSEDTATQYASMKFHLNDNLYYIAFRGTDYSLVGWKEDFMMSYQKLASQDTAVRYLEEVMHDGEEYIVGGHSKGGHLALYGACHISDEKRRLIKHIYNNDGPGLCPEVTDISLFEKVRDRYSVIVPEYCVFGKIFAHDIEDIKIVSSTYSGINQHDIISWGVDHGRLDIVPEYDPESLWINNIAERWLEDVTPSEREALITSVFDIPESRGVKKYTEAVIVDVDSVEDLAKNVVESGSLRAVAKIPEKVLFGDLIDRLRKGKLKAFLNANQLIEGVVFLLIGLLMAVFSRWSFHVIILVLLGGFVLFQLAYTIKKLKEHKWNFYKERARVYIFLAIAALFAIIMVKNQAVFIVGSGIAGAWLLVTAYTSFLVVKQSKKKDFAFWKNLIKAILYAACGIFILIAPIGWVKWFVIALGAIMAIDGICTIIYSLIQANDKYAEKYGNIKGKGQKK